MSTAAAPGPQHAYQEAEGEAQAAAPSGLTSLPDAVLARCARDESGAAGLATFGTNKALAKTLLHTAERPCFTVKLANRDQVSFQGFTSIMQWAAPVCSNLELILSGEGSKSPVSIHPLLDQLHQTVGSLPTATRALFRSLVLDAQAPASLAAVLPNLRQLELRDCRIPPSTLPLAGCTQLTKLQLGGNDYVTASPDAPHNTWLPQLQQLTSLRALSALALDMKYFPTSFLPLLAAQLTSLQLGYTYGNEQRWEPGLAAAAQCINLQQLTVKAGCTAEKLSILTTLTQLQQLEVVPNNDTDDAIIHTLLEFPNLTRLVWGYDDLVGGYADLVGSDKGGQLQQSHADSPCNWKQLVLNGAAPQLLSRLPLQSLTQPLQLDHLRQGQPGLTLADVRAAGENVARIRAVPRVVSAPEGLMTIQYPSTEPRHRTNPAAFWPASEPHAALLRAAAALLPQDTKELELRYALVDAQLVVALQEVLPTISRITLWKCSVDRRFWSQLADSIPQLKGLEVLGFSVDHDIDTGGPIRYSGVAPAANITLRSCHERADQEEAQWEVQAAVEALGLQAKVVVRGLV